MVNGALGLSVQIAFCRSWKWIDRAHSNSLRCHSACCAHWLQHRALDLFGCILEAFLRSYQHPVQLGDLSLKRSAGKVERLGDLIGLMKRKPAYFLR